MLKTVACKPSCVPDEVFTSTEPIVLQGLVRKWPSVKKALIDDGSIAQYLCNYDQGTPLVVYEVPAAEQGRVFYNKEFTGFNFSSSRKTLSEVLDQIQGSNGAQEADTLYVGSTMVDHWLPGFRKDNDIDLQGRESLVSIWCGNQSRIAAHYDFPNNIACSLAGRRKFTLFAPHQADNLYIGPIDFTPSGQAISLVNFATPDFDAHPNFAKALDSSVSVTLNPGDAIYIPSMWWHHVESLDNLNVLINYWWRAIPVFHGSPNNALQHAILAMRDLPKEQREVWKAIFERYVFDDENGNFNHIPEQARGMLDGVDEELAASMRSQLSRYLKS